MRVENELPPKIKQIIRQNDSDIHNQALYNTLRKNQKAIVLPMHITPMKIVKDPFSNIKPVDTHIVDVILPDIDIIVNSITNDGYIQRHDVSYHVHGTNKSFPISHVYNPSGNLCLGNIFVPSLISQYSPQQPLETLLLVNDRIQTHGNPQIKHTSKQQKDIVDLFDGDTKKYITQLTSISNWIAHDTLWNISHHLLTTLPKETAMRKMAQVYAILYPNQNTN